MCQLFAILYITWFFAWCCLNCGQSTTEARIGSAGIHKNSILVSRICCKLNLFLKLYMLTISTTYTDPGDSSVMSNACRNLFFRALVPTVSRIHTGVGEVLQYDERKSRRQARDRFRQLGPQWGRLEGVFQRNALAGSSILCQRHKGTFNCCSDHLLCGLSKKQQQ